MIKHVEPYPIDLLISDPSLCDLTKMASRQRIAKVQIGLVARKSMQIPFAGRGLGPRRFVSHEVLPIIWRLIRISRVFRTEDIYVRNGVHFEVVAALDALRSGSGGQSMQEPGMLVRCMIHDQVQDDLNVALVSPVNKPAHVKIVAEFRINHMITCRVIPLIPPRGLEEGVKPYSVNSQIF